MIAPIAAPSLTGLAIRAAEVLGQVAAAVASDPSADTDALVGAVPTVSLNPFGTLFTAATWLALFALNGWCFWRLLGSVHAPTTDPAGALPAAQLKEASPSS